MEILIVNILQLVRLMPELITITNRGETSFYSNPKDGCITVVHSKWNIFGISCNLPDRCGQKLKVDKLSGQFWNNFVLCQRFNLPMVHPSWDIDINFEERLIFPGYFMMADSAYNDSLLIKHRMFLVEKHYWLTNPFANQRTARLMRNGKINKEAIFECGKLSYNKNDRLYPKSPTSFSYTKMPEKYIYWQKFLVPKILDPQIINFGLGPINKTYILEHLEYPFKFHFHAYDSMESAQGVQSPTATTRFSNCYNANLEFIVTNDNITIYMVYETSGSYHKAGATFVTCDTTLCTVRVKGKLFPYNYVSISSFVRPEIFIIEKRGMQMRLQNITVDVNGHYIIVTTLPPKNKMRSAYDGHVVFSYEEFYNVTGPYIDFTVVNKAKICGLYDIDKTIPFGPVLVNDGDSYTQEGKIYKFKKSFKCNTPIHIIVETSFSNMIGIYQKWILSAVMAIFNEVYDTVMSVFEEELWDLEYLVKWIVHVFIKILDVLTRVIMETLDDMGLLEFLLEAMPVFTAFYIAVENLYFALSLTTSVLFALYVVRL